MASEMNNVLVVDDTEANIDILVEALSDDYEISVALDGESALEAVAEERPEIILLDIMMPGMDGYEVCRRLKADCATRDIPVIFITAMADAQDEARGLAMGAIDYITKPINPALVRARVKNHLDLAAHTRLKTDVERIMRHDLRTPLTAIVGLPPLLLLAENLENHQRDMVKRIEEAGYLVLSMVNLSTALFKMECGTYRFAPETVNLLGVVRKVLQAHEGRMEDRGLDAVVLVDGAEPSDQDEFLIMGEELLCYSMLANLVANAVDASPENEALTISLDHGEKPRISIRNKGEVPEAIRDRFFEKYATEGKTKGTGLGTYSAKLIAKAHGGEINMETGRGETTVFISLPGA